MNKFLAVLIATAISFAVVACDGEKNTTKPVKPDIAGGPNQW